MPVYILLVCLVLVLNAAHAAKTEDNLKDQYCVDPRTMRKHAAYSEWADAYSCSRHRCQPGGRNLAIYTVGCKRVEAPESAIECEEVVEDTNMQFPYCCTRLRCLVVVRGEVWTRVLGQPWEALPAAPWSHMYKMKRPPPGDSPMLTKQSEQGPIYELQVDKDAEVQEKVMRANKAKHSGNDADCKDEIHKPYAASPDIVIALTTGNDETDANKKESLRERVQKPKAMDSSGDVVEKEHETDIEEASTIEKTTETSDEKFNYANLDGPTSNAPPKTQKSWSEIPQNEWSEHEALPDDDNLLPLEVKQEKDGLQALVDAIGNRMKDIEDVVQRMSEKVVQKKTEHVNVHMDDGVKRQKHVVEEKTQEKRDKKEKRKKKKPNPDSEHYKRFSVKNRSKYLRTMADVTSELPLFVEDTSMNGYFSDASNTIRRGNSEKEPILTYMAPVDNHRKNKIVESFETEPKHKKRNHKKKKSKTAKGHKKHHDNYDDKHFNKISSLELEKTSLEDNSAIIIN